MNAMLRLLINGEFAGRKASNADVSPTRPICKPADYAALSAVRDEESLDAFERKCRLVDTKFTESLVTATAYLPPGYCEGLKRAFDDVVMEEVYRPSPNAGEWLIYDYKGATYRGNQRTLARGAQLKSHCLADGSLQLTAPKIRPRATRPTSPR